MLITKEFLQEQLSCMTEKYQHREMSVIRDLISYLEEDKMPARIAYAGW